MLWQPLNLTEACATPNNLTACSNFGYIYLNLLIQLLGRSRNEEKRRGINGRRTKKGEYTVEEYDFIVVGAGPSGCVMANRLTEIEDWNVLLLEAGPEQPDVTLVPGLTTSLLGSSVDWSYTTQPNGLSCLAREGKQCTWPRGKMMGGTSSINTMVYVRGNKLDYDGWAAMGNAGWSYDDVLPYFRKFEDNMNIEQLNRKYHGVNGPQPISRYPYIDRPSALVTEALTQIGLPYVDTNAKYQFGNYRTQAYSAKGERVSSSDAYIEPIRNKRKNLSIKTEAEVIKILINKSKRAYGVKYVKNGIKHTAFARKEVIVSAGTINSPKLLMLSGIGPKEHLQELGISVVQDLQVGKNLHDHVSFTGIIIALPNELAPVVSKEQMLALIKGYTEAKIKTGPLSSTGTFNSVAFYKSDPSLPAIDIQIQTDTRFWREYIQEPVLYEKVNIFPTVFYDAIVPRIQNVVPYSRGMILLNASNPDGPPLIYPNYLGDERDLVTIQKGMRMILDIEHTEAFKSSGAIFVKIPLEACNHTVWGTDEYVECMTRQYTFALHHQAGTCKMGPADDNTAVVDNRLRVYGVKGLRVIDCSIMPVVIRGNTNAAALVIAEVASDMLKEDFGLKINKAKY